MSRPGDEIAMAVVAPFQPSLLDYRAAPPQAKATAPEQARQAARVGKGIDEDVVAVAREFAGRGPFHLGQFTAAVLRRCLARGEDRAPDSPRRRLSALVKEGIIDAECVSRSGSLWVVRSVRP